MAKFAMMAYDKNILNDSQGYNELLEKLVPYPEGDLPLPSCSAAKRTTPSELDESEAVKLGIAQAKALMGDLGDNTNVGATVVIGDSNGDEGPVSLEYWKARALSAEEKAIKLESDLTCEKAIITKLREELATCGDSKQKFSAQADLASTRVYEYKAANPEPFIESIKPQLACLPTIQASVKELLDKVVVLGEVPTREFTTTCFLCPSEVKKQMKPWRPTEPLTRSLSYA